MSVENVAVIKAIYEALAQGDMPAAMGKMSSNIVWYEAENFWYEAENFPYADRNPYRGPEAVSAGVLARSIGEWDEFELHMDDLIDGGERVVAVGRYSGTFKGTGKTMNPQAVHVWTVKDGKAIAFQQHIDTLAVARATGAD